MGHECTTGGGRAHDGHIMGGGVMDILCAYCVHEGHRIGTSLQDVPHKLLGTMGESLPSMLLLH